MGHGVDGRTRLEESSGSLQHVLLHGEVERGEASVVGGTGIGAIVEQRRDALEVAFAGRIVQFGAPVTVDARAIMALWSSVAHRRLSRLTRCT